VDKREIAPPGSAARFQNVHGADGIVEKLLSIFFGNYPASAWARAISARTDNISQQARSVAPSCGSTEEGRATDKEDAWTD